ncbi:MAG: RHS repeat-associated core domain-containing protein, partial [Cytophagales bacterium]|nr:RHS repeat-associated core domain-containing protein [Cytophagales bacterium]
VGRVIRTLHPDGSFEKVIFDPWHQENFDRNDTVLESTWYTDRSSPDLAGAEPTDPDQRAAWLAAQHASTPQIVHLDTLARPFLTVDDNGSLGQYETRNGYDIKGNVITVTDAKGRLITTNKYNLLDELINTESMDAGDRWMLSNVLNSPIRMWDSRDQAFRNVYDALQRPRQNWVQQGADPEKLVTFTVYGEGITSPETNNLRGQVYQVFDPAGLLQSDTFDFKGNLLESFRQYAKEYKTTPDWSVLPAAPDIDAAAAPLLENETFTQQMAYDALNRPTAMTMPDNSVVKPTYNEANLLETVEANLRGSGTATSFVTNIDYNARGQREKIVYGNGSQTRYTYDPNTFRLTRLLTTRNTGADILQDLNYIFDAAGNITEQIDNAQQTVFFNNTQVDPHGKYTYDALYRLIEAEGRELIGLNAAPGPGDVSIAPLPNDTTAVRRYTQQYEYDELGNTLKMIHQATAGNWTRHYHYNFSQNNYLLSMSSDGVKPTTDEYTYDAHGSIVSMPHLATMSWDFADRLQVADLGGGGMAYYVYDGAGERVRKVIEKNGGVKEERLYLGDWEVYRESQSGMVQLERESLHIMDDTKRISLVETLTVDSGNPVASPSEVIRYQLDNHLGSAALELDDVAAVISYEEYHPFGTTSYRSGRNATEISLKRYRYVGKERDDETGIYYYGARYYAVWLARFISVDPLKDDYPYYTPYQYAGNKPITFIDLDGAEEFQPPLMQTDNTNAILINQRLRMKGEFIERELRRKRVLKENAIRIIEEITGRSSQQSTIQENETASTKPLINKGKNMAIGKAKKGLETTIDLELKRQGDILREEGVLTTNKGRNLKTRRFKEVDGVKQPVNFGFVNKQGEVETTKGIIPTNSKIKNLNRIKGGLKLFNFIKDGPAEEVFAAVDLARVYAGLAEPESILPLSFIAEDQFREMDALFLETAINLGFEATEKLIQNSPSFNEQFEFVFTNEADAIKLLSGEVKSLEELEGFRNDFTIFDKSNPFALLISRTRKDVSVNAIFFNKNGFE